MIARDESSCMELEIEMLVFVQEVIRIRAFHKLLEIS